MSFFFFTSLLFLLFHHTNPFLIPSILKNSSYHKLLKLCITEALLSVGYQKASASALQCFTDIIIQTFQSYDIDSLINFMEQNYVEKGESVLHKMNVLPKNLVYKPRGGGILTDNYDEEVLEDVEPDVVDFVNVEDDLIEFEDVQGDVLEDVIEEVVYEPWMSDKDYFAMLKNRRIKDLHCYDGNLVCELLEDLRVFYTREVDKCNED